MTLKSTVERLAKELAEGVLVAIRSASLAELVGTGSPSGSGAVAAKGGTTAGNPGPRARKGKRARRSSADISAVIDRVVAELKKNAKSGLRSEQLQKALGLDKKAVFPAVTKALAAKKIRKTGQKRSTTYFAK